MRAVGRLAGHPLPPPLPAGGRPAVASAHTPNALSEAEGQHISSVLRSAEYCDLAPAQVWARLLEIAGRGDRWSRQPHLGDEFGQVLQRVVEMVLPEWRELEVLADLGWDR